MTLSVGVRWGPARTAVNGTLVARPVRMAWQTVVPGARAFDRRVKLAPPNPCPAGNPCK
jgi:hypothetical protein